MREIIIFLILVILCLSMGKIYANSYIGTFNYIDPHTAVKEMDPGWNLGNSLDAIPDEISWGNPKTEGYIFDDIKKSGFRSVRIPVTWADHMGSAPDYKVDSAWMDRVVEVVNMALERDLYVIINVHHDSWIWLSKEMKENKEKAIKKLEKLWLQIADRFKNYSEKLIFEIINEPSYEGYSEMEAGEIQNEVNERILKIIRNSGGYNHKRLVVIPPLSTDSYKAVKYLIPPDDPNIIIGIHYYSPWDFVANWWGRKNWGSDKDKEQMDKDIKIVREKFPNHAIIIGEYGVSNGNKPAEWYFFDYLIRTAKKYNMATFYWDNGFDNFDRRNRVWRDETIVKIIMNASAGKRNAFLYPGVLYIRENKIQDEIIDIELNNNTLLGIYLKGKKLELNKDYIQNSPNKVILKKDFLRNLLKPQNYGIVGTLIFKFSESVDYPLNIIQYKEPVLLDKPYHVISGVLTDLKFLISFNGTKLCAIKMFDAITGRPIRDSWTPYLRGWDDFSVYESQVIIKKHVLENLMNYPNIRSLKIIFEFFPAGVVLETNLNVI